MWWTFTLQVKSLYAGNPETFDLCCQGDKISFEYNKDYTISTRQKFERTLQFTKGVLEKPVPIEDELAKPKEEGSCVVYLGNYIYFIVMIPITYM